MTPLYTKHNVGDVKLALIGGKLITVRVDHIRVSTDPNFEREYLYSVNGVPTYPKGLGAGEYGMLYDSTIFNTLQDFETSKVHYFKEKQRFLGSPYNANLRLINSVECPLTEIPLETPFTIGQKVFYTPYHNPPDVYSTGEISAFIMTFSGDIRAVIGRDSVSINDLYLNEISIINKLGAKYTN